MGHAELGCQQDVGGGLFSPQLDMRVGIQVLAREIHVGAIHKEVAVKIMGLNKTASVAIEGGRRKYSWRIFTFVG